MSSFSLFLIFRELSSYHLLCIYFVVRSVSIHKCEVLYFSCGHGLFLCVRGDPTST